MEKSHTLKVLRSMQNLVYLPNASANIGTALPADVRGIYQELCTQAVAAIEGCDHASLMVVRPHGVSTLASSSEVAAAADRLEVKLRQGPCFDALDDGEPDEHVTADLAASRRWPELAAAIRANTRVRGAAGYRLRLGDDKLGALNLFSETPGALTPDLVEQGAVFAAIATLTLAAVNSRHRAMTMEAGLASNRVIGTAVGLVMAAYGLDAEGAFGVLSRLSQDMNRKLTQVAADVIDQHGTQRPDH